MDILRRARRSAFAFPLAALTALAVLFISESSYWNATQSLDELGTMGTARTNLQTLLRRVVDAETGQRGYLLTGRKEYLEPYRNALEELNSGLDQLRNYYARDPRLASTMKDLETTVHEKLSELATTMRLHDEGGSDSWLALMNTDIGKEKMEAVRRAAEVLLVNEAARVAQGRKDVYSTLLLNRLGVGAMTALSLLALYMYLRQSEALARERRAAQLASEAERDRLETEVHKRTQQLTLLAQRLQTAREDERSRLARELHDELGALLTAAKLDVARLKSRLGAMPPETLERLSHLNEALNSGIALKRRIIEDLRPSSLSNLGLVAALEILTREFAERSGIAVQATLERVDLSPSGELMAYRLVQEALTNVSKYAHAKNVSVRLETLADGILLSVQDDGAGFDPDRTPVSAMGLLGMRYRVEAEGGTMTLQSAPGGGTRIDARLPQVPLAPPPATAPAQDAGIAPARA